MGIDQEPNLNVEQKPEAERFFEKFKGPYEESTRLGEEVNLYIQGLFSKAQRSPEDEYECEQKKSFFEENFNQSQRIAEKLSFNPLEIYGSEEEAFKMIYSLEHGKLEKGVTDRGMAEWMRLSHLKGESGLRIEEEIIKLKDKDRIRVMSKLGIVFPDGRMLDLSNIIPVGFAFRPAQEEVEQGIVYKDIPKLDLDLEGYAEKSSQKDIDYFSLYGTNIFYGNLIKEGGILSVLHEISHAWQKIYYKDAPGDEFKKLKDFIDAQEMVKAVKSETTQEVLKKGMGDPEGIVSLYKNSESTCDKIWKVIFRDQYGDEKEMEEMIKKSLEENGETISMRGNQREAKVPKNLVDDIVERYARRERDAWACAVRILRFLKDKGLDLEPEMEIEDINEKIYKRGLDTYQEYSIMQSFSEEEAKKLKRTFTRNFNN